MKDMEKNSSKNSPLPTMNLTSLSLKILNMDISKTKNITFFILKSNNKGKNASEW